MESIPDYYAVLDVSPASNKVQIQSAFRAKAQQCHPSSDGSPEKMREVLEAWNILGDHFARQNYDAVRMNKADKKIIDKFIEQQADARARSASYPKQANTLESWLDSVINDAKNAKYDANCFGVPTVSGSISGHFFAWAGGLAACLLVGFILMSALSSAFETPKKKAPVFVGKYQRPLYTGSPSQSVNTGRLGQSISKVVTGVAWTLGVGAGVLARRGLEQLLNPLRGSLKEGVRLEVVLEE